MGQGRYNPWLGQKSGGVWFVTRDVSCPLSLSAYFNSHVTASLVHVLFFGCMIERNYKSLLFY